MNFKITDKSYKRWLGYSIAIIYLIIIAGAVVRMTGSGMGCPDWPKCFGYLIPPTQESQLEFSPNTPYKKGMVIIREDALRVARADFFATSTYNDVNWEPYTKHDYAVFNVYHTWTEYINRLLGAVGGVIVLIMAALSLQYFKTKRYITILSFTALAAMLIQAVIGKIVVDTNLSPMLITIHMVVALLIVGLLIYLYHEVSPVDPLFKNKNKLSRYALVLIALTLVQVAMGTQVRQYLDHQVDNYGLPFLSTWLEDGPIVFFIHRSFSILLMLVTAVFVYKATIINKQPSYAYTSLCGLLVITILSGVLMNYVDFPFGTQAVHLVLASFILGVLFFLWMRLRTAENVMKERIEAVN